jgi:hypothetical protein
VTRPRPRLTWPRPLFSGLKAWPRLNTLLPFLPFLELSLQISTLNFLSSPLLAILSFILIVIYFSYIVDTRKNKVFFFNIQVGLVFFTALELKNIAN